MHYFFKSQNEGQAIFAHCKWLNPMEPESECMTTPICSLTVTDKQAYWHGTVTRRSLDGFTAASTAPLVVIAKAVTAALQGEPSFEGQAMGWKASKAGDRLQLTLLSFWHDDLPIQLGSISLELAPDKDHARLQQTWFDGMVTANLRWHEMVKSLEQRNADVEQQTGVLETDLANMASDKVADEYALFAKFTLLLNAKKRRVRRLLAHIDRDQDNSTPQPVPSLPPPSLLPSSSSSSSSPSHRYQRKRKASGEQSQPSKRTSSRLASASKKSSQSSPTDHSTTTMISKPSETIVMATTSGSSKSNTSQLSPDTSSLSRSVLDDKPRTSSIDTPSTSSKLAPPSQIPQELPAELLQSDEDDDDDFSTWMEKSKTQVRSVLAESGYNSDNQIPDARNDDNASTTSSSTASSQ